ncbi:hypothetical protein CL652_00255 [bacterium]|nr:hypothetical protein [bacterium]|tara:strand:+ start:2324 stop:2689 length:366 start_codon:yes stop_codon:yes gene_type:complete
MKFIDEMRERPEDERLAFAALSAGAVALILFLIWGITSFRSVDNTARIEIVEQAASVNDSFQEARNEFSGAVDELSFQYQQLQRALEEAGVAPKEQGTNAVELTTDGQGNVQVDSIIINAE